MPLIDASGVNALKNFVAQCRKDGTVVIMSGLRPDIAAVMRKMGLLDDPTGVWLADDFNAAVEMAGGIGA